MSLIIDSTCLITLKTSLHAINIRIITCQQLCLFYSLCKSLIFQLCDFTAQFFSSHDTPCTFYAAMIPLRTSVYIQQQTLWLSDSFSSLLSLCALQLESIENFPLTMFKNERVNLLSSPVHSSSPTTLLLF